MSGLSVNCPVYEIFSRIKKSKFENASITIILQRERERLVLLYMEVVKNRNVYI